MDFHLERDSYGVPHVRGETEAAAWFGMGYACAQDRLFQMDYDRRRACGRWAEVAGAAAVAGDVLARRLRLAAAAEADVAAMSPRLRAAFEAYAGGVNAAVADGALPLPLRDRVEAWQPWHSVAAFKVRHVLMGQWQHKLVNGVLLARIGPDAFSRLETRPPLGSPLAVPPDGRVSRLLDSALGDIVGHLGFLAEAEPGSNAWAVSGRRTTHGGAVLCNDSHRALDTPNVYWQCRVSCPEFDMAGATFPGLPGFWISGSTAPRRGRSRTATRTRRTSTSSSSTGRGTSRRTGGPRRPCGKSGFWCAATTRCRSLHGRRGTGRSCTGTRPTGRQSR